MINLESPRSTTESGINMNKNILQIIGTTSLVVIAYSAWNASKTYELQVQTQ